jgi:NRPS condensation-like uncharacterized protein
MGNYRNKVMYKEILLTKLDIERLRRDLQQAYSALPLDLCDEERDIAYEAWARLLELDIALNKKLDTWEHNA